MRRPHCSRMPDPWNRLGTHARKRRGLMPTRPARPRIGSRRDGRRYYSATLALFVVLCIGSRSVCESAFYPATLQSPDGAITLNSGGNYVEPYFATKALIVAQDGGLDVHKAAEAWIGWALPRQRPDGLFRRFCRADIRDNSTNKSDAW